MKKAIAIVAAVIVVICAIIFFVDYRNGRNDAIYIFELNGEKQGNAIATITWDDTEQVKTIIQLINEAASSDIMSTGTQMKYKVELVNVDVDNDFFEIGFIDGMVCCTGTVQGLSFDHAVSTTITENDINRIIDN